MDDLKYTPVSPSINRPILLLGCERNPIITIGLILASLLLPDLFNPIKFAVVITLWLVTLKILQTTAKKDPNLLTIYFRRLKYKAFYPAFSRVF